MPTNCQGPAAHVCASPLKCLLWLSDCQSSSVLTVPCVVYTGQQFSTRVDVLSKEFVAELEKLQVRHICMFHLVHSCRCCCIVQGRDLVCRGETV